MGRRCSLCSRRLVTAFDSRISMIWNSNGRLRLLDPPTNEPSFLRMVAGRCAVGAGGGSVREQ